MEKDVVEISTPTPEDAEGYVLVHKETWLATYPNEKLGITKEDIEILFADIPERIKKRKYYFSQTKDVPGILFLVAKIAGKVVAICDAAIIPNGGKFIHSLQALYASPPHQGKHIGQKLLEKVIEWASGYPVYLWTADYIEKTLSFYKKNGFKKTGKKQSLELVGTGKFIPIIEMVRVSQKTF